VGGSCTRCNSFRRGSSSCERGSVTSIFTKGDVLVRRHSSVGIATRYGPDGPGIESRWGRDFPAPVQTDLGAHSDPYTRGTGHVTEGKVRSDTFIFHPI
jgi:hypothetical protein